MLRSVLALAFSAGLVFGAAHGSDVIWNSEPATAVQADVIWNAVPATVTNADAALDPVWDAAPVDAGA
ncbi:MULTISPECIES: 5'-nucleotidase [unclassified Streptomyces]|uniref:5'-nucleotidase n=1 Tax=Streptomyces sp. R35 TaxID=3238630 RepID=A0AB39SD44_9ACTN|nr:5'-nucleotidase [Streptomyces sp. NBC_01236]